MVIGTWRKSGSVAESRNPWRKSETSHPSTRWMFAIVGSGRFIGLTKMSAGAAWARDTRSPSAIEAPPDRYGGDLFHRMALGGTEMRWRFRSPSRYRQTP